MGDYLAKLGSATAKAGFENERKIAEKFNDWENDEDAKEWLVIMGYDLLKIQYVKAIVINGYKSDLNVKIQIKLKDIIDVENIQVKLVSNKNGFNQIDKSWLKNYRLLWNFPDDIFEILKYFTGELTPYKKNTKDNRRMFANEFSEEEQNNLLNWINNNKILIVSDVIKGRGEFSAEWVLVIQKINNNFNWVLKNINEVIQYYFDNGEVKITPRGSIKIGKITIQRKGGDSGRITANMLQFKINPIELFDIK